MHKCFFLKIKEAKYQYHLTVLIATNTTTFVREKQFPKYLLLMCQIILTFHFHCYCMLNDRAIYQATETHVPKQPTTQITQDTAISLNQVFTLETTLLQSKLKLVESYAYLQGLTSDTERLIEQQQKQRGWMRFIYYQTQPNPGSSTGREENTIIYKFQSLSLKNHTHLIQPSKNVQNSIQDQRKLKLMMANGNHEKNPASQKEEKNKFCREGTAQWKTIRKTVFCLCRIS